MSNGEGQGGRPPPSDDRTLLDPLSNDELKALREARQRMQAQKAASGEGSSAISNQVVIGPDEGEDIGNADTRAMPALPAFDGRVSLDQIGAPTSRVSAPAQDPASSGPAPSEPMSVYSTTMGTDDGPTITPGAPEAIQVPNTPPTGPGAAPFVGPGGKEPVAGATGFGENTLMWMSPPKVQEPSVGPTPAADVIPKASAKETALFRLKTVGAVSVLLAVVVALIMVVTADTPKGVVELHTDPPRAQLKLDGKAQHERTPVKLSLTAGPHEVELSLAGHAPKKITLDVSENQEVRKEVVLQPLSQEGLMTVTIAVQPVAAQIDFDTQKHSGKRQVNIANLDKAKPHRVIIKAAGYHPIDHEIPAGQLKANYSFALQKDPSYKPE